MAGWPTTRDLFSSPTQFATAWVQPFSIAAAGVKEDRIECGHGFGRLAVDGDSIWVTNAAGKTLIWAESDWTIYDLAVAGDWLLSVAGLALAGAAFAGGDGGGGGGHHGGGHGGGGS